MLNNKYLCEALNKYSIQFETNTFHPIWSNFHYVGARSSMDGGRRNAQNEDNQQTDLLSQDSDDNNDNEINDDDDNDDDDNHYEDNLQNDLLYKFPNYSSVAMMMAMS